MLEYIDGRIVVHMESATWLRRISVVALFGSIGIALIVSLSSLWLSRVFFSKDTLSEITTTALAEQSSRDSIGSAVADSVFEDSAVLRQVAGPRLASLVSSILGTDLASSAVDEFVERVRVALTTSEDETVTVNFKGLKDTIAQIQSVIGQSDEEQQINVDTIPDTIVVIESDRLPDIYKIGITVFWLGPISFVYAIGALAYWIYRGRKAALWVRIRLSGLLIVASSVVALLAGPLIEPLFVSIARQASTQTLLGNLYAGLITPFQSQAMMLFVVGVFIFAAGYLLPMLQTQPMKKKKKRG